MLLIVDVERSQFRWTWDQGQGLPATGFEVGCGTASGDYTALPFVAVALADRTCPINRVVQTPGAYFAAVRALGQSGAKPSAWSNEVNFQVAEAPEAPTAFTIEVIS